MPTASANVTSVPVPQVAVSEVRTATGFIMTVATFRRTVQDGHVTSPLRGGFASR
jgi:hypothetical protein